MLRYSSDSIVSQSSSEDSGIENWKTHKWKTDNCNKLPRVQEVPEEGRKLEPASCTLYRTHSSCKKPKQQVYVLIFLLLFLLLLLLLLPMVVMMARVSCGHGPCCPDGWVGYQWKCYNVSEAEGNWDSSQSQCSALGASLAGIDSLQELTFLMRHKGPGIHWIGLRREGEAQPWKWANGTRFNTLFNVMGGESCAYLNDVGVSSSRCLSEKKWICSKPSLH